MSEKRALQQLAELGQSVWIDFLSRELLTSGELARLVREDAVVGVTSNPAIFEKRSPTAAPTTGSCATSFRAS